MDRISVGATNDVNGFGAVDATGCVNGFGAVGATGCVNGFGALDMPSGKVGCWQTVPTSLALKPLHRPASSPVAAGSKQMAGCWSNGAWGRSNQL